MSRQYLNDRWCVRCTRRGPTPYLRDNVRVFTEHGGKKRDMHVLDVGCGNCRNTTFMRKQGYRNILSLDMAPPAKCIKCTLGQDPLPAADANVDIILCNYVLMFLNRKERTFLLDEIMRVAGSGCYLMVELYPAVDSDMRTDKECLMYQHMLFNTLVNRGWTKLRYSKMRFIMRREDR